MIWSDVLDTKYRTASYSLKDLRIAKGMTQEDMADLLKISRQLYHFHESGHRRPTIDTLYRLAVFYNTSMEFVYHAFNRQHLVWYFPDKDLAYSMRQALEKDAAYMAAFSQLKSVQLRCDS